MASDRDRVAHICDVIERAGRISARPMFGEYGLYCASKLVGLICDNQLFLKPTPQAMALREPVAVAPAYPGGKPMALAEEALEDADLLCRVVATIASELSESKPRPKPGKPKTAKGK